MPYTSANRLPCTTSSPTIPAYARTGLGSTTLLTDETGNPLPDTVTHYLPFGSYRATPPHPTLTDRGFTGHKHNNELGLIYMNARYYIPSIARFLSPDTLVPDPANPQSFNRYAYVLNNPLAFVDPSGHRTCTPSELEQGNDFETCDQVSENLDNYGQDTTLFDDYQITEVNGVAYILADYNIGPWSFFASPSGHRAGLVTIPIDSHRVNPAGDWQSAYASLEAWEINARNIWAEMHGQIKSVQLFATGDAIALAHTPYNRMTSSASWRGISVREQLLRGAGTDNVQFAVGNTSPMDIDYSWNREPEVKAFALIIAFGVDQGYLWDPAFGSQNYNHNSLGENGVGKKESTAPVGLGYFGVNIWNLYIVAIPVQNHLQGRGLIK